MSKNDTYKKATKKEYRIEREYSSFYSCEDMLKKIIHTHITKADSFNDFDEYIGNRRT